MKLHILKGYISTIYLAEYPDKILLLDGCSRPDAHTIKKFILNDLKRPISDLKLVIVTHIHPDHSGAVQILRKWTGCKIAHASGIEKDWYAGFKGFVYYVSDVFLANVLAFVKKKPIRNLWFNRKIKYDIELQNKQFLPGFEDWQALHTPGHTLGDLSLYHADSNSMYISDLIIKTKGSYFPPLPVLDPDLYLRSLDLLCEINPKHLYLAHSGEAIITSKDLRNLSETIPVKPIGVWSSIKGKLLKSLKEINNIKN